MNCSYDPTASYATLLKVTQRFFVNYVDKLRQDEQLPGNKRPLWFPLRFSWDEYALLIVCTLFWKRARPLYTRTIGRYYCDRFKVDISNVRKVQENLWNLAVDTFLWLMVAILVQEDANNCNLFQKPSSIFEGLNSINAVPLATKLFYMLNMGKYMFGIYAVLYLDERRKDFPVMIMHHLVTLVLLSISYVARAYRAGLLVIFVHDVVDIFMISAKILIYSTPKGTASSKLVSKIIDVLAVLFVISWTVNRLYLYPLRAIYYASFFPIKSADARILGIAYLLLFAIFLMDIYWTYYIIKFIWRVIAEDRVVYDPITDPKEPARKKSFESFQVKKEE